MREYFEIELAKAKAKKPDKFWKDPHWIAEEKLDGWRFALHLNREFERPYMTGRRVSKTTGGFSEKGLCAKTLWPQYFELGYTILDGEVMPPDGANFRDMAGIMNTSPEKAEQRINEIGSPWYYAFDILWWDGVDVRERSYLERRDILSDVLSRFIDNSYIVQISELVNTPESMNFVVDRGGEGLILKNVFGEYGEDWIKVKRSHSLDVVVTGFTDAKMGVTGKYLGQIGAAVVSVYGSSGSLIEVGRVSGMTDDIRKDMTDNPGKYLGTVIEIEAQEFGRERLRHPRYKRHRPDAHPHGATFAKMKQDLGMAKDAQIVSGVKGQMSLFSD